MQCVSGAHRGPARRSPSCPCRPNGNRTSIRNSAPGVFADRPGRPPRFEPAIRSRGVQVLPTYSFPTLRRRGNRRWQPARKSTSPLTTSQPSQGEVSAWAVRCRAGSGYGNELRNQEVAGSMQYLPTFRMEITKARPTFRSGARSRGLSTMYQIGYTQTDFCGQTTVRRLTAPLLVHMMGPSWKRGVR
jgi:hypothetical protein